MGTQQEVHLTMADGIELAATLYLPDPGAGPQPCLLEALPYRKDDLTSSYTETYERMRDEFGFACCRVDVRGTGSSQGDPTDEYPEEEQSDLAEVIAWLAEQEWCNGSVGMFGTSYSGFNSLQMAVERPPALKAICAIYATDDRWTDDVHWRGGALRLVDLVDYDHYMTPMVMLPPVPAVWGDDWRDEWLRRIETSEPWVLTWLRENRHGPYWDHGSVRLGGTTDGYDRIDCAVMIVAGWADGYRNNSFRTLEALGKAGTPHRLLAGPWAHAGPATAMPGPRIDLDVEMAAWFDRWLRGPGPGHGAEGHRDSTDVFVRTSTRPEPDLDLHEGYWISVPWPSPDSRRRSLPLPGPRELVVEPDVGTTAWIDCAGHLPWGLSTDQQADDARSLTWEWPAETALGDDAIVGQPRVRLRLSASSPAASLSVKLCDVFPDGTSALIARGSVDLAYRGGVHGAPEPLVPDEVFEVEVELDACAYQPSPGQVLRLSVAGADWPNTIAPPAPVTLSVEEGALDLSVWDGPREAPAFTPGEEHSSEDPDGVTWSVTRDVLRRETRCDVHSSATYDVPHGGQAVEDYRGVVRVDQRTFAQAAEADCTFRLSWPGVDVRVTSRMTIAVGPDGYDVVIDAEAFEGADGAEVSVGSRSWSERVPR